MRTVEDLLRLKVGNLEIGLRQTEEAWRWANDRLHNAIVALHGGVGAEPGVMAGNLEFFAQLIDEAGVRLGEPIVGPGVVQETLRRYAKTIRAAEGMGAP